MACIVLWSSAVRIHDSQACRKMDMTRERISRILELREILCHSKLVSVLSMLLLSVLSWKVSQAWKPHQLELSSGTVTVSSFCPFNLCADAAGVVCHQLGLLGTDLHAVGCGSFVETLNLFCHFFFLYPSAKWRLVIVLPPVLTVPS